MHHKKSDHHFQQNDVKNQNGQYNPNRKIDDFGNDQSDPLCLMTFTVGIGQVLFLVAAQSNKIRNDGPFKGQQTVK